MTGSSSEPRSGSSSILCHWEGATPWGSPKSWMFFVELYKGQSQSKMDDGIWGGLFQETNIYKHICIHYWYPLNRCFSLNMLISYGVSFLRVWLSHGTLTFLRRMAFLLSSNFPDLGWITNLNQMVWEHVFLFNNP